MSDLDTMIAQQRKQWNAKNAAEQRHEAEKAERKAEQQAALKEAQDRVAAQQDAELRVQLRANFAGTDVEFEKALPAMKQAIAVQRALQPTERKWGL
jgi:hypothetical protein